MKKADFFMDVHNFVPLNPVADTSLTDVAKLIL